MIELDELVLGRINRRNKLEVRSVAWNDGAVARKYFAQIVKGVVAFHQIGIAHRHLNLRSVFLLDETSSSVLCDFALTLPHIETNFNPKTFIRQQSVLQDGDAKAADVLDLGRMLYLLLTGDIFPGYVNPSALKGLKPFEIELLNGMLATDSKNRWSIQQVSESQFLGSRRSRISRASAPNISLNLTKVYMKRKRRSIASFMRPIRIVPEFFSLKK